MNNKKDRIFIELLKKHTDVDVVFINTFFKIFQIGLYAYAKR